MKIHHGFVQLIKMVQRINKKYWQPEGESQRRCTQCGGVCDGEVTIEVATIELVIKGKFCGYDCHRAWRNQMEKEKKCTK